MTDTDMLRMAALEARLTEAEKMLDQADVLLNHAILVNYNDILSADEYHVLLHHAILVNYNDIKSADELQREIRKFLEE